MNMSGDSTRNTPVILTPRDHVLLSALTKARILDCDQVRAICGFTSVRRANARLLRLHQGGFLRRWFSATRSGGQKALYGLSRKGAISIGQMPLHLLGWKQGELVSGNQFVSHQEAVNDIFVEVQFRPLPPGVKFREWQVFFRPISSSVPLMPDGYFEIEREGTVFPMFLELDRGTESLKVWRKKVEHYINLAVTGESQRVFHQDRFRVLIVALSDQRLRSIRRTVSLQTDKLFWFSTLPEIKNGGLWDAPWLRPKAEARYRLLSADVGNK
ncbi:MAG: replication-relaxation family protein [Terriglobales bacterium]